MKRVLWKDEDGIQYDWTPNGDGTYVISASQDCTAILDRNKAMATHNDGYSPSRELRRAATIPNVVALKWLQEEGFWYQDPNAKKQFLRKLNDPDWQYLRTAPGRI